MTFDHVLDYYTVQSKYTDFADFSPFLDDLPDDIAELCRCVRNVIEHFHGVNKHKIKPLRLLDIDIRHNKEIMARINKCGYRDLLHDIAFSDRVVGTCRSQAVFMCGLLREKGIPARVRYKYCTYFVDDFNHEQVVVEYWCSKKNKWLIVDPAMNHAALAEKGITIHFDLCNVPDDKSMSIAEAWQLCRNDQVDPAIFGAFSKESKYCGFAHIRRKLYQDLACINKVEVIEWDRWGVFQNSDEISPKEELYCDYLAMLMNNPNLHGEALYACIEDLNEGVVPITGVSVSPVNSNYDIEF